MNAADQQSLAASVTALTLAVRVSLLNHPNRSKVIEDLRKCLSDYDAMNLAAPLGDHSIATGRMALEALIQSLERP